MGRTEEKIMQEITEILVQTQFQYWVDKNTRPTAEEANSQKQRAIDCYLGKNLKPNELTPIEQANFHNLINLQTAHIGEILNAFEEDGLVEKLVKTLEKYGKHKWDCNREINGNLSVDSGKCTCGYLDIIAEAKEGLK